MRKICALMACIVALQASAAEPARTLQLASLEWMPFSGAALPEDGLSSAVIAEVEKRLGNSVKVQYFGWTDAVAKVEADAGFAGYFPVYYTAERAQSKCHLSQLIGKSETGIGYLKESPVQWKKPADLVAFKIGVVEGYANSADFDAAVKQGTQPVEMSSSDTVSVRKLVAGKVKGIVVDRLVLRFLTMKTSARDSVVFSEHLLNENTLHVCFRRSPAGKAMQEAFDAGLKTVDIARLEAAYLKRLEAAGR
ncbi:MAG: transporter substrate-binding domain-containing protein [Pseudomonadota bacterium]